VKKARADGAGGLFSVALQWDRGKGPQIASPRCGRFLPMRQGSPCAAAVALASLPLCPSLRVPTRRNDGENCMIRPIRAAWRLMLTTVLLAGLLPFPAMAKTKRQEDPVVERIALASAEARQMRAQGKRIWCVPFARTATGVQIKGNAKLWWAAAEGRYARGDEPQVGSVMAFAGSRKMPMGHVAVVAEVVSDRVILIDHANWKRNQISLGMVVMDVSPAGDWSAVRVEGDPGVLGRVNPVHGFIYPDTPQEPKARKVREERVASR